jgi:hypothetical protein
VRQNIDAPEWRPVLKSVLAVSGLALLAAIPVVAITGWIASHLGM